MTGLPYDKRMHASRRAFYPVQSGSQPLNTAGWKVVVSQSPVPSDVQLEIIHARAGEHTQTH